MANSCSRVAGAHCDEVGENPEANRQQEVSHQYKVQIPRVVGTTKRWNGTGREGHAYVGTGHLRAAEVRMSNATWICGVVHG